MKNNPSFIAIIPARYASTRFPGKPLAKIGGVAMIERVYRRAEQCFTDIAVATDDVRIAEAVSSFGGLAVMTSDKHRSGTDRCREAYEILGSEADVVVNIQGDEPFIALSQLEALKGCFGQHEVEIASLARPFDLSRGYEALADPNTPKVVLSENLDALYFSRSVIPYIRGCNPAEWPARTQYYTHVGLYGYRADVLKKLGSLPQSELEKAESLEQLRWLQNGYRIKMAITDEPTIGIDTPADLEAAEKYLASL